jgi:hypothetical protein
MEKDFLSKNYTWQGVVLIIVGVLSAIVGVGVLLIILGIIFLAANKVILHIDKDHLTFKAAPLAGKKFVLFADIEDAVYSPNKIMLILNTGKKLRILKTNFTPEDWEEINTFFKGIKPPKEE